MAHSQVECPTGAQDHHHDMKQSKAIKTNTLPQYGYLNWDSAEQMPSPIQILFLYGC
jgi:hypothetical protein